MGNCCSHPEVDDFSKPSEITAAKARDMKVAKSRKGALPVQKEDPNSLGGLDEVYEIQKFLGAGATGKAYLCKDRETGQVWAAKLMKRPLNKSLATCFSRELTVQAALGEGHVNIVKPADVMLTRTHLCVAMEYVPGGNLAEAVVKRAREKYGSLSAANGLVFEEDEARYYFRQIISALAFAHEHHVAHRDMKLDNVMLDMSSPPRVKVIDFGFSNVWEGTAAVMTSFIGTTDYMSPQVLSIREHNFKKNDTYDATKADVWAAGVLLVVMLTGRFPFDDTGLSMLASKLDLEKEKESKASDPPIKPAKSMGTELKMLQRNVSLVPLSRLDMQWVDMPSMALCQDYLSEDVKSLLDRCFELKEQKRADVIEVMDHPWFKAEMSPMYEFAWQQMQTEQAERNKRFAQGAFRNKQRDNALDRMIKTAQHTYNPGEQASSVERLSVLDKDQMGPRRISLVRVPTEFAMQMDAIREDAVSHDTSVHAPDQNGHDKE